MFKNELFDTKLRTWVRGVSRLGTLCGVLAMVALIPGCPPDGGDPPPIMCDDATPCEDDGDACTTVACVDDVCATSDVCPEGDTCDAGVCSTPCDDTTVCDDGNDCTDDACGDDGNCAFTNNDANACDDGNACTDDACTDGACVGANNDANACDDGDLCTDADACTDGVCGGTAMDCGDGDLCTDDECLDGVCSNPAVVCPDGETCDPATGDCSVQVPCDMDADCDDTDMCTTDTCGADLFCSFVALDCSDGDTCTDDVCTDGVCSNPAVVCGAGESCVGGTCLVVGSFNFTLDDDTLNGTSGDDVFTAGVGTLNPADIAVGNGGTDTLNASIVGTTSGAPTLIDIDNVNFTTLNDATFDATNSAAIGTYGVDGDSSGGLTLTNVNGGVDLSMGSGFPNALIVGYTGTAADYTLTLNGPADGASYDCTGCNVDVTVNVAADSWLGCGVPGTDCFGGATDVIVTGSAELWLTGARPGDLANDGGAYDMDGFTGSLIVVPEADAASNYDFSTGGADELDGVGQVTIIDTLTNAHTLTFDDGDGDVTVDISEIDVDDSAGALTVVRDEGDDNDDSLTVMLGGEGDGMGALTAATSEFVNIVSGGTTANAIANVTSETGTSFVTESVTVTGTQDCDLGTVTTEAFDSTGLDAAAGVTLTAGASMQIDTGPGADDITGSGADDLIDSGAGNDTIAGGAGADTINTGDGNNTVQGDGGADTITLGTGDNTVVLVSTFGTPGTNNDGADTVTGFGSGDSIELVSTNGFADGTGDLVNAGATNDKIGIANDGTDTTIVIDIDTAGTQVSVTIVLLGVTLTDADFTFDAATDLLTAN